MTEPCVHPELEPDYCEDDEESLHCDQQPEEDEKEEAKNMETENGDKRLEEDKKVNSFMLPIGLMRRPPPYFRLFDPLPLPPFGQMGHVPPNAIIEYFVKTVEQAERQVALHGQGITYTERRLNSDGGFDLMSGPWRTPYRGGRAQ
uniref:Uncharacterized protein n=1 Tax=Plectus sambesii TaxID=2011161 RepID=A0A914WD43_9BILA